MDKSIHLISDLEALMIVHNNLKIDLVNTKINITQFSTKSVTDPANPAWAGELAKWKQIQANMEATVTMVKSFIQEALDKEKKSLDTDKESN